MMRHNEFDQSAWQPQHQHTQDLRRVGAQACALIAECVACMQAARQRMRGSQAPSSSWAWGHPQVRPPSCPQQGPGQQRRARGQPASERVSEMLVCGGLCASQSPTGRCPDGSAFAPSSSWAWGHPRARQQPWARPQPGQQRRARGPPARCHARYHVSCLRVRATGRATGRSTQKSKHSRDLFSTFFFLGLGASAGASAAGAAASGAGAAC